MQHTTIYDLHIKNRHLADIITGDIDEAFIWRQETTDSRRTQERGRPMVRT